MITPILEKLIFEGKAQYKTFVMGFTEKHQMNIPLNRYIIITDLWYTPTYYFDELAVKSNEYLKHMITQLAIIGNKGFNRFLFKNSIFRSTAVPTHGDSADFFTPNNPIHITCFLIHDNTVSFTLSNADEIIAVTTAISPTSSTAIALPGDYGKTGIAGALPVINRIVTTTGYDVNFFNETPVGIGGNNEYSYPVDLVTQLGDHLRAEKISFPIINVGYVEILGQAQNVGY